DEERSDRDTFEIAELQTLFSCPVFTEGERPKGGQGEAAFWLPLLALFTGARLGELAGLTADDVRVEQQSRIPALYIRERTERGRRLKTSASERVVPVHRELIR